MILFFLSLLRFARVIRNLLKEPDFRALVILVILTLAIGAAVYHEIEGRRWLDSLYFSVMTLTTIGYGDFAPKTDLGKIFTIYYVFVGLGLLAGFINILGQRVLASRVFGRGRNPSGGEGGNEINASSV